MRGARTNMVWAGCGMLTAIACGGGATQRAMEADSGLDAADGRDGSLGDGETDASAAEDAKLATDATPVADAALDPIDAAALEADANWSWIALPAGTFVMGGGNAEPPENVPIEVFTPDAPTHTVNVPAFEMLRAEVTVAQYRLCVRAGACTPPSDSVLYCTASSGENNWLASDRDNHPVNCITPGQAAQFCGWAGGRLPSEAEWEYAARSAGKQKLFAWGDGAPSCSLAAIRSPAPCPGAAPCECGGFSQPVCSKPEGHTEQGLCDITGNLHEPVADDFHYTYDAAPVDGSAWGAFGKSGITRGGHYKVSNPFMLRVSTRATHKAAASSLIGARCVR